MGITGVSEQSRVVVVSAGKIVLLVFGIIGLLVAVGLLLVGGFFIWLDIARTDNEGFVTTRTIHLDKTSHAIVTEPVEIDLRAAWLWDWSDFGTIKVEGSNDNPLKQVFIGIARDADVKAYLSNVEYDEIGEWRIWPHRLDYTNHPGTSVPAAPTTQIFWTVSAHGAGTQTLEWELEEDTYSLVLMNDDGSSGVDLSIVMGAKVSWILWIGVGFLAGGAVALIAASLMVYFAARRKTPQE